MYPEEFAPRLIKLRMEKGISARDMSLSIGQNPSYINTIESGKALPSMTVFFYICEYLNITPAEFFETDTQSPVHMRELLADLKRLSPAQLDSIHEIVKGLIR
ncbi:MAG TPA: XRE family transcriptional regulator [Clostridiales bacterium]|nr:XRE family transcriptional regulator [Clostridiales bacterium]